MPRSPRLFIPGAVYHVYCRTARGEMVFSDRTDATQLVATIANVAVFLKKHPGSVSRWLETPSW